MSKKFKIALSVGSPTGVGPEISVSAANKLSDKFEISLFGPKIVIDEALHLKEMTNNCNIVDTGAASQENSALHLNEAGRSSFEALEVATTSVYEGTFDALVTGPIDKAEWNWAGIPFTGHTEYLANRCSVRDYAMMMANDRLRVVLATIHCSVSDIPKKLTMEKIITSTRLTQKTLKTSFGIGCPKIAIASLNPHCGDSGLLGKEEEELIIPAIKELKTSGIEVYGPISGDIIFAKALEGDFDAIIAMYHDQGLAAIKTFDYKKTVNITLGLPIIRTSVDHGTAKDIAWKGIADDTNMIAAIEMAGRLVATRNLDN